MIIRDIITQHHTEDPIPLKGEDTEAASSLSSWSSTRCVATACLQAALPTACLHPTACLRPSPCHSHQTATPYCQTMRWVTNIDGPRRMHPDDPLLVSLLLLVRASMGAIPRYYCCVCVSITVAHCASHDQDVPYEIPRYCFFPVPLMASMMRW